MTNSAPGPDEAVYSRYLDSGDPAALEMLVARWHGAAFRVASCLCRNAPLAEEAVQDAFLKLLSRQARFTDRGPGSFRAWFLSLVTNCARMARRAESRAERRKSLNPRDYVQRKGWDLDSETQPGAGSVRGELKHALGEIGARWSKPVELHFLDGMPQKELAAALGLSQQMVSRRIVRGLSMLRLRLAGGAQARVRVANGGI